MRKTLTALVVVLAAGSLAACKMPWDKEQTPPPAQVATTGDTPAPVTPAPDATAGTEPAKPADQTASADPAKTGPAEPAKTSPAPAAK